MTKNMQSLIKDATAAGYSIKTDTVGTVYLTKKVGRWRKVEGLVIYGDGTALRCNVHPSVATGIRSYKVMRNVLGI